MTPFKKRTCPLTKRLAEDLMIRNMAEATIDAYTYHVRAFADFISKPLTQTTVEDVRTFQLHLIDERKLAYSSFNQAVCALRFYFTHTQPEQLTKTRYFGGWSNNRRAQYMSRCRTSLKQLGRLDLHDAEEAKTDHETSDLTNASDGPLPARNPTADSSPAARKCSHCGSQALTLVSESLKPSWREIFWRECETCPPWYATLQREEHRLYWTAMYGADIYDCYMQRLVESAEETTNTTVPHPATELQPLPLDLTLVLAYETIPF